jgi:hypothetical protein
MSAEVDDEDDNALGLDDGPIDSLDNTAAKARVKALVKESERKEDYQKRLQRKLQKLDADLAQRREEVEGLQRTLELERKKKSVQAESDKRERSQKALLQEDRIRDQLSEVLYRKTQSQSKNASFELETVLVSFTRPSEAMLYNLTFRLDSETTVEQLRDGACKYWGVDTGDYILMTMGNSKCHGQLKVKECFKHGEIAQLRLEMRQCENVEVSEAELKGIQPKLSKKKKGDSESARFNKEGVERIQKFGENYVPFLRKMGGIYFLLKLRDQKPSEHASKIKLRDFVIFTALAVLTFALYATRRPDAHQYWYMQSIEDKFMMELPVDDAPDSAFTNYVPSFRDISTIDEVWWWLNRTLPVVIWNPSGVDSKSLRNYNLLPGFFSIRVQNSVSTECGDSNKDVVAQLDGAVCTEYWDLDNEDKADLPSLSYYWDYMTSVNVTDPAIRGPSLPWRWRSAAENEKQNVDSIRGLVNVYSASGYQVEYRMDIEPTADQLNKYNDDFLTFRRLEWINIRTRVVIVALTTYNFDYDCWASITLLFEIPPSGRVVTSSSIRPFQPSSTETRGELRETIFDIVRCMVAVYILLFIGMSERRHKTKNHKAGARYYASLNGICDVLISVLIFASALWRFVMFGGSTAAEFMDLFIGSGVNEGFYATKSLGDDYNDVFILEGIVFMLIMFRIISLCRISPTVYLLWHTIGIASKSFLFMAIIFLPTITGFALLAQSAFGESLESFDGTAQTIVYSYAMFSGDANVTQLLKWDTFWSSFFVSVFYTVIKFLLLNVFATVMVDSYYVVRLTCSVQRDERGAKWWLHWACPGILVSMLQSLLSQNSAEG